MYVDNGSGPGNVVLWTGASAQGRTLLNNSVVGSSNVAVTVTLLGAANTRVHVYRVGAFCSAGVSSLTISDGAVVIYRSPINGVGLSEYIVDIGSVGLTGTLGNNVVVTLNSCGIGNVGTVNVVADRF